MTRWVPLVIGAGGAALASAVAVAHVVNGADPSGVNHYALTGVSLAAALPVLGALIVRRHPGHRVGMFVAACGWTAGLNALCNEWLVLGRGELPASDWAAWTSNWLWYVGFFLLPAVLLMIFPTGHVPHRGWRPVALGVVVIWAIDVAWMMSTPFGDAPEGWAAIDNPFPWVHGPERLEDVWAWWPLPVITAFVLPVGALVHRLARATGVERRQLLPFALAAIVQIAWLLTDLHVGVSDRFGMLSIAGSLLMPVGAAIGIFRYDMLDIERLVSRSLTFAIVAVSCAVVFGFTLLAAGALFGSDDAAISALGVGLVAAAALPIWRAAQGAAERLLFGDRADPAEVMRRLGLQLEALVDPRIAPRVVVDTIATSLRLPYVSIVVDGADPIERGSPRGETLDLPLQRTGRRYGHLQVSSRSEVDPFNPAERRLLEDLARDVAAVLRAAELHDELTKARHELVTAREEERRRIRNDLHDGLGPQLAGVGLQLDILRGQLSGPTDIAANTLVTAKSALGDAISDIRRLVQGLRPPALDEVGLISAIRQQIASVTGSNGSPLDVMVDADEALPELQAAVEVAAFRIVSEAVTNVVRHSGARHCTIRVRSSDHLDVEVRDDGSGVPAGACAGVGMASMRERAHELGGVLTIESTPDGTIVRARLPLGVAVTA